MDFFKKVHSDIHYLTAKEIAQSLGIFNRKNEYDESFIRKYFNHYLKDDSQQLYFVGKHLVRVYPFQDDSAYLQVFLRLLQEISDATYILDSLRGTDIIIVVDDKEYYLRIDIKQFRQMYNMFASPVDNTK